MKKLEIYTDGGCSGNPGPGGWAYVLMGDENLIKNSGAVDNTTNNRMELKAVIEALKYVLAQRRGKRDRDSGSDGTGDDCSNSGSGIYIDSDIDLYTDSMYVKNGISQWIKSWEKNGWKCASGKPVKNKEIWVELRKLSEQLTIRWHWVMAHAENEMNELCDTLVKKEIKNLKKNR